MEVKDKSAVKPWVTISGTGGHSPAERQDFANLLTELLAKIGEEGEFKLNATTQRVPGRATLKGVSIAGIQNMSIVIAYQTAGNDTRYKYYLGVAPEKLEQLLQKLKAACGTSYQGEPQPRQPKATAPKHVTQVAGVLASVFMDEAPSAESKAEVDVPQADVLPKVFFTKDHDRMTLFMVEVTEAADCSGGIVKKDVVLDLIVKHAELPSRFRTGPMLMSLISKGWLVPVDGDTYRPDTNPVSQLADKGSEVVVRKQRKQKRVPLVRNVPGFAEVFLGNAALVQVFLV
jgi:hypothetical protein